MKNLKDLGTLKLIALSAYVLSLIIFFLPINFQLNDTSNKLYNYFIAAGNSENNPMVTMILTALALIISIILILKGKSSNALITGLLSIILFIALLVLIPDKEPRGTITIIQVGIRIGAYISPILATIGTAFSLISFIQERTKKNINEK